VPCLGRATRDRIVAISTSGRSTLVEHFWASYSHTHVPLLTQVVAAVVVVVVLVVVVVVE